MTEARFPHVAPGKGHYESFYPRAVDPALPRGAWIRHTTHQRPGGRRPARSGARTPTPGRAGRTRSRRRAEVTVRLPDRELRTAHGGVYEHGVAPGAHAVVLQPFPDG